MKALLGMITSVILAFCCICFPSCQREEKQGSRYEINAEYREETQSVSGTVKVTFVNTSNATLEVLKFNLYPNAYRKNALYPAVSEELFELSYYAGESYGEITVTSVNGAKTWAVGGADENILTVTLISPLAKNEEITLDLSFVTELAKVEHRLGVGSGVVNLVNFYPRLCKIENGVFLEDESHSFGNPFRSDIANYLVRLTAPSRYEILGVRGEVVKGLESKTKYEFSLKNARDFACVLAEKPQILTTEVVAGKKEVEIEYFSQDLKGGEEILEVAKEAVAYFSESFGSYLYPTLTIIRSKNAIPVFSNTAILFLSENLSEKELLAKVVEGIARQWWGIAVGSDEVEEAWQTESMIAYSAICFFEKHDEYGLTRSSLVRDSLVAYKEYFSVYGSIFGGVDTRMSRSLKAYANAYEYERLSKDKGVIMLDTLRKSVGDKPFFSSMKDYYKANCLGWANPKKLCDAFSKNGLDTEGFFKAFLLGKAVI